MRRPFGGLLAAALVLAPGPAAPARGAGTADAPGVTAQAPAAVPAPPADRAEVRALLDAGRYRDAEILARRRMREVEAASPVDEPAIAAALDDLVEALWRQFLGGTSEARALAERAIALRDRPDRSPVDLAASLRNLAIISNQSGDYRGALALFERVLHIQEAALGPDSENVARALTNLGGMLNYLGDYSAARECQERAVAILMSKGGAARKGAANALSNLGSVLGDMGDLAGAQAAFEESLRIREEVLPPGHPETCVSLDNLGAALLLRGDRAAARPVLERGLKLREASLGEAHPHVALSLANLGRLALETGDVRAAVAYHERAVAVREKALGPDHMLVATSLTDLGEARLGLGDVPGARAALERAADIQGRTLDPRHPGRARTLATLAEALRGAGEPLAALDRGLEAERVGREHFRVVARSLSEHEALTYEGVLERGLDVALTLLVDRPSQALPPDAVALVWDSLIRSRALVLDEMAERNRTSALLESPSVAALRERVSATSARLARLVTLNPPLGGTASSRAEIEAAWEEAESAERALGGSSELFRSRQDRARQGLREVRGALSRNVGLVAYVAFDRLDRSPGKPPLASFGAFVLPPGGSAPAFVWLGTAAAIEQATRDWLAEAGRDPRLLAGDSAEAAYRRSAGSLRALVWDPLPDGVRKAKRLLVVPDGALHLVNLATLPDRDGGYLVETGPLIHHLSAERDLLRRIHSGSSAEGLLAVGGIDFDAAPATVATRSGSATGAAFRYRSPPAPCPDIATLRFEPLPATISELEDVVRLWKAGGRSPDAPAARARDLTGAEADEATFKTVAGAFRVLHLATHGFVATRACDRQNPLLVAGLALAGANRRAELPKGVDAEDGLLTAGEIAALDLSGVQWAVLSACRTGVGEIRNGEGILGLRRAFEIAGAGTLIMSLWPVEDEATRVWMSSLYAARARGADTATAVREASRGALAAQRRLHRTTHPFFWGGFVAAGDWR